MGINKKQINELIELSEETGENLAEELIDLFLKNSAQLKMNILIGITTNNLNLVEAEAHKLKSSSGTLGLTELSDLAFKIMNAAEKREVENVKSLVNNLPSTYRSQINELIEVRVSLKAS